jgi:hypothetical protein
MNVKNLVAQWFDIWKKGNFEDLPLTEDFLHTSPYGTIKGKTAYMDLVNANREKFLGHSFNIHDLIFENDKACIMYTAIQKKFRLEVTEWHYVKDNLINKIIAYYNIPGEVREDRKLEGL